MKITALPRFPLARAATLVAALLASPFAANGQNYTASSNNSTSSITISSGNHTISVGSSGSLTRSNAITLSGGTLQGGIMDNVATVSDLSGAGNSTTYVDANGVTIILRGSGTSATTANLTLASGITITGANQLLVGGGAGGGGGRGSRKDGGGGGGGFVVLTTGNLTGTLALTAGGGSAGAFSGGGATASGGNSSIGATTASGGGGAASSSGTPTGKGGDSGRNINGISSAFTGAGSTQNETGGGGAGSSANGTANSSTTGGAGGNGTQITTGVVGLSTYMGSDTFGGGGGGGANAAGGAGGTGGGGAGGTNAGVAGTNGLGGGGGGGAHGTTGTGGAGGAGSVAIQYAYDSNVAAGNLTLSGGITLSSTSTLDAVRSGGLIDVTGAITGAGGLNIASSSSSGGVVRFSAANTYSGATTINSGGTLEIGNGLTAGSLNATSAITVNGTLAFNRSDDITQGTHFSTAAIGGTGSIVQNGTGTLTLSAANTYNGSTTINAGTLQVDGNIANSGLVINSGGIISPGTTAAVDTFGTSSITINGGGYNWTLSSANGSAGTAYDQITSTGALTSSGLLTVYAYGTPGDWNGSSSYDWDIFNASSVSGFSAGNFTLDFTNFGIAAGNRTGTFSFSNPSGGIIRLTYTASSGPVWTGGTGNWSTGFTTAPTEGATIAFTGAGGTATNNISNGTLTTVGDIEFRSGAGAYTLAANAGSAGASGGTALTVNGSIINDSTATQTLNTDLAFAATRTIAANTGNISIGGEISGAGGLTKNGSSTLTLSGSNTYSGATTINAGALRAIHANALGSTAAGTTVASGAALELSGGISIGAEALSLSGTGISSGGALRNISGDNSYAGAITLGAATRINSDSGLLTLSGAISGTQNLTIGGVGNTTISNAIDTSTGTLTKDGSGTLTLSGANTYTGATTISAGVLHASNATALGTTAGGVTVTSGAALELSGGISIGAEALSLSGTGISSGGALRNISGDNSYAGAITLADAARINSDSGLLTLSGAISGTQNLTIGGVGNTTISNAIGTSTGTLTKDGSGTLTLSGANTYTGATTISAGTIQIGHANGLGSGGNITFSGGSLQYGSSITTDLSSLIKNSGSAILVDTNSNNVTFATAVGSTNSGGLTKNGAGTLTLTAVNTYTGGTTVNAGTLKIGNRTNNNANVAGTTTLSGGNLSYDYNGNNNIMGTITLTAEATITKLNGLYQMNFGSGTLNGGGQTLNIYVDTTAGTKPLYFNQTAGTSLGQVNILNGAVGQDGTGGTPLRNATINISSGAQFRTYTSPTINNNITLNGGAGPDGNGALWNESTVISHTPNYTGTITLADATNSSIGNSVSGFTISGQVIGGGSLTKIGNGTLTLSGNNTYSGNTTISAGRIEIAATGRLGAGTYAGNISNNATLVYSGTNAQTLSGIISGTGALTQNAASTLTLSGNNTYSGASTINAGTLVIGNGLTAGSLNATSAITVNGTLAFNRSDDITQGTHFSTAAIGGTGSIVQNGAGTLTLNAANTYSGGTTLNTGTLVMGNTAAAGTGTITQASGSSLLKFDTTGTITNVMSVYNVLATQSATLSGAITVNNATWDIETGDTLTVSGDISGSGGVTKIGNGTLILSGSNSYNGSTVVNTGTLNATSASALGSNTTVQVNGGSLLVSANGSLNNKSVTLNSTSIAVAGLAFSGTYNGLVDNLTLSQNSIIDLGEGSVSIMFDTIVMSTYMLDIYNWTGTTLWNGGTGNDTDKVYFGPDLSDEALAKIRFHSGAVGVGDSFLGSGFDLGLEPTGFTPAWGYQIIPVPEPETWATGLLLLLGGAVWLWRKRSSLTTQRNLQGSAPSAP